MSENINNRRKHVRVYRNFILSYTLKGKTEQFDVSQINNISLGGISFISTRPFEPGIELSLKLKTPFLAEDVLLEGIVLEYKEKIIELIYEIRIKFTQVSPASQEILKKIESYAGKEV